MKLIVIEGLDGAGKSTQIGMLKEWFTERKTNHRYIHFPRMDAPWFGELIARFLRGEFGEISQVDPYLVAMLYAGDRSDASPIIKKWLSEGNYVILDRYAYSNIAYQCAKLTSPEEEKKLQEWILELEFRHFAIPRPDINIFLDVPFRFTAEKLANRRTGNDRSYLNGRADIHESSLSFQKKVREMYLKVASTDPSLEVINCYNNKSEILAPEEIFGLILTKLNEKNIL
ncbi:MAG: dTMP kinase [Bacteroidales bacterium]|nr:dTMP kinase [Bacteroidales bacterium]MDT8372798.1 dTMP kinase [Bacteroidales bacterium]